MCPTARAAALGLWHPGLACCQIIKTVKSSNLTVQYPITISLATPTLIAPDIASCMQGSWISLHVDRLIYYGGIYSTNFPVPGGGGKIFIPLAKEWGGILYLEIFFANNNSVRCKCRSSSGSLCRIVC